MKAVDCKHKRYIIITVYKILYVYAMSFNKICCHRKSWVASAQSFAPRQQATM